MLLDVRTYTCRPGTIKQHLELYEKMGKGPQTRNLGLPLAYLATQRWLQDFAYRIELSWVIFLMAGLAALGIALITVSYQAVRAALADPVKSLRYE